MPRWDGRRIEGGALGRLKSMPLTAQPTTINLELSPAPESAQRARRSLVKGGLDPDLDHTVSLLATELVANSVRHAGDSGAIRLEATFHGGYARVVVADQGVGFDPEVRHESSGFGLRLVDKLATRWGVERDDQETRVWFEVDRRRRRFDRD